jgi:hypothetical protein
MSQSINAFIAEVTKKTKWAEFTGTWSCWNCNSFIEENKNTKTNGAYGRIRSYYHV